MMTRIQIQRTVYLIAALAPVTAAGGMLGFADLVRQLGGGGQQFQALLIMPMAVGGGFLLLLSGLFLYLARQPRPWGKLVCIVGFPWIGFSAVSALLSGQAGFPYSPLLLLPGIGGGLLVAVGIVLLVLDRGRLLSSPAE
jgi:hypothetical protein